MHMRSAPHDLEDRVHFRELHRRISLSTAPILIQLGDVNAVAGVQPDSRVAKGPVAESILVFACIS